MNYNIETRSVWVVLEILAKYVHHDTAQTKRVFYCLSKILPRSLWYKARAFKYLLQADSHK